MKPALLAVLASLLLAVMPVAAQPESAHEHRFSGAEKWAKSFDNPQRDAWQRPAEVIAALGLAPDARVADIGAGTGYFAVRLARALPRGQVLAIDAEPDMVRYLGERARKEVLANVTALRTRPDDPGIPEPVDLVLLVNTFHHLRDRERYFREVAARIRPSGRLAVIDYTPESPIGPPKAIRVPPERVRDELARAGWVLVAEPLPLPYQFFHVYRPGP